MDKEVDVPPVAMQEIKAWMEAGYAEARGPFTAARIGASEFVIMRISDLEEEEPLSDAELRILDKGYVEAQQSKTRDALESLAEIQVADSAHESLMNFVRYIADILCNPHVAVRLLDSCSPSLVSLRSNPTLYPLSITATKRYGRNIYRKSIGNLSEIYRQLLSLLLR